MTMKNPQTCLSAELLRQLSHDELSPAELKDVEDHVSDCERCRQLLEVPHSDPQWQDEIVPILRTPLESRHVAGDHDERGSEGESLESILRLLGPTDDPRMLGRIGSYEVVGVIGRGGMGVVFKAYEGALNRFVAIKMLLPHLAASGAARKRFAREGQAAAAVIDDNVMPIYSVAEWQGVPYLVTQYSRGATLQKRIQDQGPLELKEVLRIGMQTARGLAAAHAQGLVHRDVKPSNILLDGTVERALLTDFGLARAVDDASITRTGIIAGTPQYMSPEQARGGSVDGRSDLFGLGCVLYAMCTGRPPFRADSSYAILRMITDDEPHSIREVNPDIPEWLCLLISRLMAKSPDVRFGCAQEVAELLEQCLAHVQQPTAAPLPSSLSRPRAVPVTRHHEHFLIGGLVMIASLAFGLMALFAWLGGLPPDVADDSLEGVWELREKAATTDAGGIGGSSPPKPGQDRIERKNASSGVKAFVGGHASATSIRIAGKCFDETGMPVEGATIDLYANANSSKSLKRTQTRSNGVFEFGEFPDPELIAGSDTSYIVVGRKDGKAIGIAKVFGYLQKSDALDLVLDVAAQLKGTVTGPDGSPLRNAQVRVAGYPWIDGVHGAITNEAGEYVLERIPPLEHPGFVRRKSPDVPGAFELIPKESKFLLVEHPDLGAVQPMFAACPETIDVHFDEPAKITGRIVDEHGKPVRGITVTARPSHSPVHRDDFMRSMVRGFSQGTATTDAEGRYSLSLQHSGAVEIDVIDQQHFAKTVSDVVVRVGEVVPLPDFVTVGPAFVSGRIVDVETGNTVTCPRGVRLRVYVMGQGSLTSIIVRPDGTYRLPVLPGTSYVYFSSTSLTELTKTWDVLEHPHALTAKNYPVTVAASRTVEVNFPVQLNKAKLGKDLQSLQGEWELQRGTYIANGNARLPLTDDQLVDGNQRPLRFSIRGNQRIGVDNAQVCSAQEPGIVFALYDGIAEMTVDAGRSPPALCLTRIIKDQRIVSRFLYRIDGDHLELACHSNDWDMLPASLEPLNDAFVLVAKRVVAAKAERKTDDEGAESETPGKPANPQLALDGYCAVCGVEHQVWIKGEPHLSVDHKGLRYLFLSEEEQEMFRQSPKKYALALGGRDVVEAYTNSAEKNARPVNGTREFAGRHEGRTYLFSTMKNMETFFQSPDIYAQHVDAIENLEKRLEALEAKRCKTLGGLDH